MSTGVSDCCGAGLEVRGEVSPSFVCAACGYGCGRVPLSRAFGPGEPGTDECDGGDRL